MRRFRFTCGLLLVFAAWAGSAAAQVVMVDLGSEAALLTPEVEIGLPIILNTPDPGPAAITLEIGYPGDTLRFIGAKPGSSVEIAGATLTAEKRDAKPGEKEQVLVVEIKGARPLITGTLGTLTFGVTPAAKVGAEIHIRNLSRAVKGTGGQAMEARGADGLITLEEPPAPCFFYMH
jgi:hypothetical protein